MNLYLLLFVAIGLSIGTICLGLFLDLSASTAEELDMSDNLVFRGAIAVVILIILTAGVALGRGIAG